MDQNICKVPGIKTKLLEWQMGTRDRKKIHDLGEHRLAWFITALLASKLVMNNKGYFKSI